MAFAKKTWKDRIAEFPTRRRLTKEDNTSELVTVAREEGTLSQEGDAFSAENMNDLENRIDAEFTEVNGKLLNIVYEDIFQYGTTEKNIKEITNISSFGTYLVTAYVRLAGNGRKTHVKIKLNEQEIAHLEDYIEDGVYNACGTISAITDISSDTDKITISAYSDKAWANVDCLLILNIKKITLA